MLAFVATCFSLSAASSGDEPATRPAPPAGRVIKAWPTLTPDHNAAIPLLEVARRMPDRRRQAPDSDFDPRRHDPADPRAVDLLRNLVRYFDPELQQLDGISADSQFDWGVAPASPIVLQKLPPEMEVGLVLAIALLNWDAELAARDGDLSRAFRRAQQVFAICRALETYPHLTVRRTGSRSAMRASGILAGTLAHARFNDFAASARATVEDLIADHFSDDACRRRLLAAMRIEQAIAEDAEQCLTAGTLRPGSSPALDLDGSIAAKMLHAMGGAKQMVWLAELAKTSAHIDADGQPFTWLGRKARLDEHVMGPLTKDRPRLFVLAQVALPQLNELARDAIDDHARRRTLAVALAVRLYQIDHQGALPADLNALVGRYLPGGPIDPGAAEPRWVQYRPAPSPAVWSTGPDRKDNAGNPDKQSSFGPSPADNKGTDYVINL